MGKGLLFFCCACFILVLTIVNLSIGPIVSGTVATYFDKKPDWGTLNCKLAKDSWDYADELGTYSDDQLKYQFQYPYDACQRGKGMHDMEYTAFIFDIVIGFICGLLGLLHLFDLKKDFVSNTGLIGLICGVVGFVLTLVYAIFNGLVYTTVYVDDSMRDDPIYKRDGDYVIAEVQNNNLKCLYFDNKDNPYTMYAKISDLGKKQYNYDKDGAKDYTTAIDNDNCKDTTLNPTAGGDSTSIKKLCTTQETIAIADLNTAFGSTTFGSCKNVYLDDLENSGIENKDISDRFLTTLILSLFVCLASIGLALFGFLLFRTPGDF